MLTPPSGPAAQQPIQMGMGRSAIGLCMGLGSLVGGYLPVLWGAGSFSLESLLFSGVGAVAGVWVGVRVTQI